MPLSFLDYCLLREGLIGPGRPRATTTSWPKRPSPHRPRRRLKGEPTLKLGLPQLKLPPLPKLKDPVRGK